MPDKCPYCGQPMSVIRTRGTTEPVEEELVCENPECQPRPKTNWEAVSERLKVAANAADRIKRAAEIIKEACERNPNGLPF